ncbi:copper chaperone [Rhodanobacter sp. TND4EL1]
MVSLIFFLTGSLPDDGEITMQFSVDNMTCGHCVRAITAALQNLDAHAKVDVDLASGRVQTEGSFTSAAAVAAMEAAGYHAAPEVGSQASAAATCCGHCHS